MSIERRALSGSIAGAVNFAALVANNLLLVPLFLSRWNQERYGVWISLLAGQAILQTLNSGHQSYVGNELNRAAYTDRRAFGQAMGSALVVEVALGLLQIGFTLWLIGGGGLAAFLGVPAGGLRLGQALLVLVVTGLLTGTASGILVKSYAPIGEFTRSVFWSVAVQAAQTLALAVAVLAHRGILAAACAYGGFGCAAELLMIGDIRRQLRRHGLGELSFSLRVGLRNLGRSTVICLNRFMEQMGGNGLVLLIGHFAGLAAVPIFTTLRTLANTAMQAANIGLQPVATDLIRFRVERRGQTINEALRMAWLLCSSAINIPLVGLLPLVPWVYGAWVRHKIGFDPVAFALFAWMVSWKNLGSPLVMYLQSNNHLRYLSASTVVRNVVILGGGLLGLKLYGIRGLAAALAAAEALASVAMPLAYLRSDLAAFGAELDVFSLGVAAVEQGVIALVVVATMRTGSYAPGLTSAAAALMTLAVGLRWRRLAEPTRRRLLGLLSLSRRPENGNAPATARPGPR